MRRLLAVGVAAVCLLAAFACSEPEPPDTTAPEVPVEEPAPAEVNYAGYVGYWCDSDNAKRPVMGVEGMDQMEILSADANTITFTVLHTAAGPSYRMTGSDSPITAKITDGVATFEFRDERGSLNAGTIRFLADELVVEIHMTEGDPTANGSAGMHCLMLRDEHHEDRTVQEDVY